ncbi:MAG TPA: carboxypeptidase regulatory-like domain-containing protein [Bryobacteraceae bacterium]|nr:carboxypeptidase regulatory-like domain-containing protein [Bryobacteraceae bacterium]
MKILSKVEALLTAAILLLLASPLLAQLTSGNLTGTVYDPTGATVPNATVVVRNDATGVENATQTTSAGDYRFENLPAGVYTLNVNAAGFNKSETKNININVSVTTTSNVNLTVGQSSTTVTVSEAAVSVDTTTAQVATTFETKQITDLPNTASGSGVLNLSLLSPGVGTSGAVGAGSGPSVGGQRPRNNNFTIEGIDNNSGAVTGPVVSVMNDAVAEMSVLQNQYSPDFGHSSGGQFNLVVKSGTNQFHGAAYDYFQNRNLNAADNLAAVDGTPLHPRFDDNRFGGNVGGPIKHNKLFFFADYEYEPIGKAGSAGLIYAPTQAGYNIINSMPGVNQTNLQIFQKYIGTAGSAVPASTFGDAGYPIMSGKSNGPEYLQPTITGTPIPVGQISIATPSYTNNEFGVGSVDWNISDKDSVRGRFILNRTGAIDTSASLPVFFATQPTNSYIATMSEYHNFSPSLINEFRFGYNRLFQQFPVGPQGFPGLDSFPNIQIQNELGGIQIGPDPNAPQYTIQNQYQATDNITLTKGAHSIKIGFDGERNISPQSFTQRSRGDYEWSYLSDYLNDFTPDYLAQRSAGNPIYWGNRWLWGWYVNDNWKVTPNLTLNLGLRYEYDTVPAGEMQQSLNSIANVPGLITFGVPQAQKNNIMPRIGFAYSPGSSGKTSIRGGFGINYDVLFDNLGLLTLPPQLSTTQDVTGNGGSNFLASGGLPPNGPSGNFTPAQARASTGGFVPDVQRPKSLQWNFGIQRQFGSNYVFESRYLGTRGINLPVQIQLNAQPVVNASNALPVFWSAPSQALLNSLTNTLAAVNKAYAAQGDYIPSFYNAGFHATCPGTPPICGHAKITSYEPWGDSVYHGWANQLTRRMSNGLQFIGSYTWSHNIDDSTAEVFSTYATPRRPQDSTNLRADRSSSALDHRNRFTIELIYDEPFFQKSNWLLKNVLGGWELAPIYTYQTGTLWDVQTGLDANLNGDTAGDRAFVNPNGGNPNIGSAVTALKNASGDTVGYLVNNPNALYAQAPLGTLPNAGRNTEHFNPINDIDMTAAKTITFTERYKLQFSARVFNIFNHPQYAGGNISDIAPIGATGTTQHQVFEPQSSLFGNLPAAFSSNPRTMVLALKLLF